MKAETIALVPAAGIGSRMGADQHKAFITLEGKPLIWHCLDQLSAVDEITHIVVALHENDMIFWETQEDIVKSRDTWKPITVVQGGATRAHSVYEAFKKAQTLCGAEFYACVHDAARPFAGVDLIQAVVRAAEETGAAGCALDVVDTIKKLHEGGQLETLKRSTLKALQTPQVIYSSLFQKGFDHWVSLGYSDVTDDFQIVESTSVKVTLLKGKEKNKKITYQSDIQSHL